MTSAIVAGAWPGSEVKARWKLRYCHPNSEDPSCLAVSCRRSYLLGCLRQGFSGLGAASQSNFGLGGSPAIEHLFKRAPLIQTWPPGRQRSQCATSSRDRALMRTQETFLHELTPQGWAAAQAAFAPSWRQGVRVGGFARSLALLSSQPFQCQGTVGMRDELA